MASVYVKRMNRGGKETLSWTMTTKGLNFLSYHSIDKSKNIYLKAKNLSKRPDFYSWFDLLILCVKNGLNSLGFIETLKQRGFFYISKKHTSLKYISQWYADVSTCGLWAGVRSLSSCLCCCRRTRLCGWACCSWNCWVIAFSFSGYNWASMDRI